MKNLEEVRVFVEENAIEMVDLKFCDMAGRWHHLTMPETQLNAKLMDRGVGFDGSALGLKSVKSGDLVLIPDLETAFVDPFWDIPTLSLLCNIHEADSYKSFDLDPRSIVRKAQVLLKSSTVADESLWGPEFEFYIFDSAAFKNESCSAGYSFSSLEGESGDTSDFPYHNPPSGGYHALPPRDRTYNLRSLMTFHLQEMGVPVKYHHHEVGGSGQVEIETPMLGMLEAGDAGMKVKYVARMTAFQFGLSVTFMPKPMFGVAGSGMHFHQMLRKSGENVFYDSAGYGSLSQIAHYYIGGLLMHGPALLALTNPSTNSYRRLVPGFEAPVNAFFSLGNRSAAIRIPKYAGNPESARMEFRPPDATCNIYLALAAQLLAGLDGIKNKIDPEEAGFGPIDEDIFSWPEARRAKVKSLPRSLEEALQALEKDSDFLTRDGIFQEEMLDQWAEAKREQEIRKIQNRPHPYEMELYFDL